MIVIHTSMVTIVREQQKNIENSFFYSYWADESSSYKSRGRTRQ